MQLELREEPQTGGVTEGAERLRRGQAGLFRYERDFSKILFRITVVK